MTTPEPRQPDHPSDAAPRRRDPAGTNPYAAPAGDPVRAPVGGRSGRPMRELRPVATLGRVAVVLLVLIVVASIAVGVLQFRQSGRLVDYLRGGDIGIAAFAATQQTLVAVGMLTQLMHLVLAILFMIWLHRAYRNAADIVGRPPSYSGYWVVLGWLLPIAHLFVPFLLVNETQRRTGSGQGAVAGLWWAAFLVSFHAGFVVGFLGSTAAQAGGERAQVERLEALLKIGLVSTAASIAAAVLLICLVRAVTRDQEAVSREAMERVAAARQQNSATARLRQRRLGG